MVSRTFPREVVDIRRYCPQSGGRLPDPRCNQLRNQLVKVVWLADKCSWQQAEYRGKEPTWIPRWFGYVLDFDAYVPESELKHPAEDIP